METEIPVACLEAKRGESLKFVHFVADSCLFAQGTVRPQTRCVTVARALCIRTGIKVISN
jgi:hypothetical protein